MWLRNIKLKWDKSAPRRAASNPQLISPVVAPHHCAPLFSMTMCQIWAFWKHFPYAIIGSLLSKRKTEKKKNGMFYTKGTESLHFYLSPLSMAYYTLCFLGGFKRGKRRKIWSFYNDCIFMDRCWMALGLSVKTSREFMLSIYGQKLNVVSLFLLRFPLLLLKSKLFFCPLLCGVFCQHTSWRNVFS